MATKWKIIFGLIAVVVWLYVSNPIVISVTGSGSVVVPATYVVGQVTVVGNGTDPKSAIGMLEEKVGVLRGVMINAGVEQINITQSESLVTPAALVVSGAKGYQASLVLTFKYKKIRDLAILVTSLYEKGAAAISQPVYQVENQEAAERVALKEALKKADDESRYLARNRWKLLRKMVAVQQATSGTSSEVVVKNDAANGQDVNLNGGVKIVRAVQVTYKMW